MTNPLVGWTVDRNEITTVGRELQRPECILAEADGTLWTADARGGVVRIAPDGTQEVIAQEIDTRFSERTDDARYTMEGSTLPNGLAFLPNGDFAIANFGTCAIERMTRDGRSETLYRELDGEPLGKTNFVLTDSRGRLWFTVTTRLVPWTRSINEHAPDGYVGLIDERGLRIVADGFVGTNEIRFDEREEWLYVVESNARRISRLRAARDGSLSDREVYGPDDLGGIPDGMAFDQAGNLWITFVNADRLIALTPEGDVLTLLDDGDAAKVANWDRHFFAGTMTPEILSSARGTVAPMMASVTFGGADLCTVFVGSLMGTTIPTFRAPLPGLPLAHWASA